MNYGHNLKSIKDLLDWARPKFKNVSMFLRELVERQMLIDWANFAYISD